MPVMFPLVVSSLLFGIGVYVVMARRHAVLVLMGVELMLNAVNLNLVAFDAWWHDAVDSGQALALFMIAIAAAEIGLGLAIVLLVFRTHQHINVDELRELADRDDPVEVVVDVDRQRASRRDAMTRCALIVLAAPVARRAGVAGAGHRHERLAIRAGVLACLVAWVLPWSSASSTGAISRRRRSAATSCRRVACRSRSCCGVDQLSASMLVLATVGRGLGADLFGRLPARRSALPVLQRARVDLHRRRWRWWCWPTTCSSCWSAGRSWAPAPTT